MNLQGKKRYRLLAICLCVVLAVVMLAGCGDEGTSNSSAKTTAKKTEQKKDTKDKKDKKEKEKADKKDSKKTEKTAASQSSDKSSKSSNKASSKKDSSSKDSSSKHQSANKETKKEQTATQAESKKCTISISASKILSSQKASEDTKALAGNGTLVSSTSVEILSGDTVKSVTKRICAENGVTLVFGDSGYVSGIGGIYEFDGGQKSGWMYSVNGSFPSEACDEYVVKKGDVISWKYTLNLGKDL